MNKFRVSIVALALGVASFSGAAFALPAHTPDSFAAVDTNGDGVVSLDELQAVRPNLTAETFGSLTGGQQVLTRSQYISYIDSTAVQSLSAPHDAND